MLGQDSSMSFDLEDPLEEDWKYGQEQLDEWKQTWKEWGEPKLKTSWGSTEAERVAYTLAMKFEREVFIDLEVITWDLCRQGLMPFGKYLMKIWW